MTKFEPVGMENYEGADLEALSALHRYQNWIVELFKPTLHGETVEFGAGTGSISSRLLSAVDRLTLVEPSSQLIPKLHERFDGEDRVDIVAKTLEKWAVETPDHRYDCVVMVNVLEHIENDREAVQELFRVLRPGGHLMIMVPALQMLFSKLDTYYGHYRRYDMPMLRSVVDGPGFQIVDSRYFDIIGVVPWYVLNTLMGAVTFNPKLMKIYDAFCVPVTKAMESVVKPPLGKNIVLTARKPD